MMWKRWKKELSWILILAMILTGTPALAAEDMNEAQASETEVFSDTAADVTGTYAIDTANVTELDANVTLEDESKTIKNEVTGTNTDKANTAVSDSAPRPTAWWSPPPRL